MNTQRKITSSDISLEELFTKERFLFRVPNYQRQYVWQEEQIRAFLDDGEFCWLKKQNDNYIFEHFAGPLILRTVREMRDRRRIMEVVDGQQRLTTFSLVVVAAVQIIRGLAIEDGETAARRLMERYIWTQTETESDWRRLMLSKMDQPLWMDLTAWDMIDNQYDPHIESHRYLKSAKDIISAYLTELTESKQKEDALKLLQNYIHDMAESFQFVLLQTETQGYSSAIYQTVNDRGLPLTAGEILRADTIDLLQRNFKKDAPEGETDMYVKRAEKIWDDILSDPGVRTDRYLAWNYEAVCGRKMEKPAKASIQKQYEKEIFQCYRKHELSDTEKRHLLDELERLHRNTAYCRKLENGQFPDDVSVSNHTALLFEMLIKALKNKNCIPLYLKIMDMQSKNRSKTLENLTPMLAKAFFTAKTVGKIADETVSGTYQEIWSYIGPNYADTDKIRTCLVNLQDMKGGRCEIERILEEDIYATYGSGVTRFLLFLCEFDYQQKLEPGHKEFGEDSIKIEFSKVSVEHIIAENADERMTSKRLYNSRQKLGNLTILGVRLNSRQKNKPYKEKRGIYQGSPFLITRRCGESEEWNYQKFKERQAELAEVLKKVLIL